MLQCFDKLVGKPECNEQFGQSGKADSSSVLEAPKCGNSNTASLCQIVLPPRQSHPVRANQFTCFTEDIGFIFKR
ncbi:hypothetical protein AW736_12115 [Termitidicoccus mucosus]|uniref:Uncharacterized protein n=1 Tax=Termitidicoccus mucosus TaxID=1184151 RepID=A0A178IIQ3_9BACT|nr:hypothetical protein AW736_12115 [Opitutaceae bacterium TSB47]